MKKLVLAAAIAAISASPAFAAGNTATTQGSATATVIAPITLAHDAGASLKFGTFTTGAGTVAVNATTGVGSATGAVVFVSGSTNSTDAFTVGGEAGRTFAITTTGGNVASGAVQIPFTTSASAATGTLNASGAATFTVGGTLTLAGTETAGSYVGSYDATVTYN